MGKIHIFEISLSSISLNSRAICQKWFEWYNLQCILHRYMINNIFSSFRENIVFFGSSENKPDKTTYTVELFYNMPNYYPNTDKRSTLPSKYRHLRKIILLAFILLRHCFTFLVTLMGKLTIFFRFVTTLPLPSKDILLSKLFIWFFDTLAYYQNFQPLSMFFPK